MTRIQWDYTLLHENKKRGLVKCPKCGRVGALVVYTKPTERISVSIKHKGHVELGMFNVIDESCELSHDEAIKSGLREPKSLSTR